MSYTLTCPLCAAAFVAESRASRDGWEMVWTRAVAHVVKAHSLTTDQAECVLARDGQVERKNGRAS